MGTNRSLARGIPDRQPSQRSGELAGPPVVSPIGISKADYSSAAAIHISRNKVGRCRCLLAADPSGRRTVRGAELQQVWT